jgi:hypothetical protein
MLAPVDLRRRSRQTRHDDAAAKDHVDACSDSALRFVPAMRHVWLWQEIRRGRSGPDKTTCTNWP